MREEWGGPFAIKGIMHADDARRAVDIGATAISVSNHGGNDLDGTPATIRVLPPIAAAVGDQVEVYLERVENAMGDAVLSRDKARREESWIKLERAFNEQTRVEVGVQRPSCCGGRAEPRGRDQPAEQRSGHTQHQRDRDLCADDPHSSRFLREGGQGGALAPFAGQSQDRHHR